MLNLAIGKANAIRKRTLWVTILIRFVRSLLLSGTILAVWLAIWPGEEGEALLLAGLMFLLTMTFSIRGSFRPIGRDEFILALEMDHPQAKHSPFELVRENPSPACLSEWQPLIAEELKRMQWFELQRVKRLLSSLPIPTMLLILSWLPQPQVLESALQTVSESLMRLQDGATLTVLSGNPSEEKKEEIPLSSSSPLELELLMQNMVEIKVVDRPDRSPIVNLFKRETLEGKEAKERSPYQSFRLSPIRELSSELRGVYRVAFSVKDDVDVFVSSVSLSEPVAQIKVRALPVPRVSLEVSVPLKKPWPDNQPLPLKISVRGENPLKQVRLVIRAEGRSSTEVVSNVLVTDKTFVSTNYDLILETYVQSDLSRVEIVAEAVDRAVPIPLVGASEPLLIETASAYGRYRQTLQTLRELKNEVDQAAMDQRAELSEEARKLSQKALTQAEESPFFDGLDRMDLSSFERMVAHSEKQPSMSQVYELQEKLNWFLFDHETIDDRERDRDFFVAARSLSRLIEQKPDQRPIDVDAVTTRLKTYLDERSKRWQLRAEYLGAPPPGFDDIQTKPFHKALDEIGQESRKNSLEGQQKALGKLSETVTKYRDWIENLEKFEDQKRSEQEKNRQEGLTNARNKLKELQKRQGDISQRLDKAASRPETELSDNWPSTRMMQNTNKKETASLEGQLRSLSPQASERIKLAGKAMDAALESGNQNVFSQAESAADLAGRLLRQAQSAAQKSQSNRSRRERRRRVSGDNYYGKQVIGADIEIKREYSVDRRYREEVLDEVSSSKQNIRNEDDKRTLEDYLRRVVR